MSKFAERPVAKSLHTITVIMQVARLHREVARLNSFEQAVPRALETLGLAGRADPYNLAALALSYLNREVATA